VTTTELLKIVEGRGLSIRIENGRPLLRRTGSPGAVTDKLLAVLKLHRDRIIELLSRQGHEASR
jgi:hypothetical protein